MRFLIVIFAIGLSACAGAPTTQKQPHATANERCVIDAPNQCWCADASGKLAEKTCEIGQCPPCK